MDSLPTDSVLRIGGVARLRASYLFGIRTSYYID